MLLQGLAPAPVRMGLVFPQQLRVMGTFRLEVAGVLFDMLKFGPIGKLMIQIGMVEGLGMSISHSGQFFPSKLVALMGSAKAAQLASGALNMLRAMIRRLLKEQMQPQEAELLQSFKQMVIGQQARLLRIKINIPREDIVRRY